MRNMGRGTFVVVCALLGACVGEVGGEGGDDGDDTEVACADPKYGDGVCDIDTSCDVVDVDCLVTFDTPEAAKAWYDASPQAQVFGASLPVSDPRFVPTQALIDEGWEAYKQVYKVGDLADKKVQLVLVDRVDVNAFAMADVDKTRAGLVVMVQRGLIDLNAPKAQELGVIMHEFHHAMALQVNQTVKQRTIKYYKAPTGSEPIGNAQSDDDAARRQYESWEKFGEWAGWASDVEMAGMPILADKAGIGSRGAFGVAFYLIAKERQAANPTTACTASYNAFIQLNSQIQGSENKLDNSFMLVSTAPTTIVNAVTKLRDDCFAGVTGDAITHAARVLGYSDATLRNMVPTELKAEIEGKTVITGLYNAINTARTKMREIEAASTTAMGATWDRLRYFSTEEAADEASTRIMVQMGLAADGLGQLMIGADAELSSACMPMLSSGAAVPYGEKLLDDHHATCWRAAHQRVIGATISARQLPTWGPLGPEVRAPLIERLGASEALREVAR